MPTKQIRLLRGARLSKASRYTLAAAIVAFLTVIRWLLMPVFGADLPYALLFAGIVIVAWLCGFGPTLLAIGLGIPATIVLFVSPHTSFSALHEQDVLAAAKVVVASVTIGAVIEAYRRALRISHEAYALAQRQRAELQQIYSSTPVGLGFIDENLCYLRVNEALALLNGVPSEDHVGRHISEILRPEIVQKVEPALQHVLATGEALKDLEMHGPTGPDKNNERHVIVSFYPVHIGELKGVHAVIADVTSQKKTQDELHAVEDQLRHALKMEAVGRLAGGVAHDFNNLLMVISSYTELLLEQLGEQPTVAKRLNAIAGATQRAARLTKQLLAFSRKQTLQPEVVEIDLLVRELQHLIRQVVSENIELVLQLDSGGAKSKVDPAQIEQVLVNLAMNSRDAMPKGGRLLIQTAVRNFSEDVARSVFSIAAGEYVEMSITDSGIGMSAEVQARIFDPFFTTKERGQGTGLGLAMVYGIIKQSGGYIEVQSTVDQGTTFRIWLPVTLDEEAHRMVPQGGAAVPGTGTVLVVEDEDTLRQAICESLTVLGYEVLEASDGEQALELIRSRPGTIDLLLTDAVMPRMSGADLIQEVQAVCPLTKLMMMSGYANVAAPDIGITGSKVTFLQKPFSHAELARIVRKLLSKSVSV